MLRRKNALSENFFGEFSHFLVTVAIPLPRIVSEFQGLGDVIFSLPGIQIQRMCYNSKPTDTSTMPKNVVPVTPWCVDVSPGLEVYFHVEVSVGAAPA